MKASLLWANIIFPEPTTEEKTEILRRYRRKALSNISWTQNAQSFLSQTEREEWQIYRDQLQTLDFSDPDNVMLPDEPGSIDDTGAQSILEEIRTNRNQFKSEYLQTIQTLTDIENATSPTNAQVIAAVKFMAKTLKLLIMLLYRLYS